MGFEEQSGMRTAHVNQAEPEDRTLAGSKSDPRQAAGHVEARWRWRRARETLHPRSVPNRKYDS